MRKGKSIENYQKYYFKYQRDQKSDGLIIVNSIWGFEKWTNCQIIIQMEESQIFRTKRQIKSEITS